jgi:hypothetical protein
VPHVDLAAVLGVRVDPRLLAVRQTGDQRLEQARDHLVQVLAGHRTARDPPQIELVRRAAVLPGDGVPAVHHPGAGQQHIVAAGTAGKPPQRGRDHGAGMAAEHPAGTHVAGVTGFPGDRGGRVAQPIVVVGDRDDSRAPAPPHLARPDTGQRGGDPVGEDLDGVRARRGIGQVADVEGGAQLRRSEKGN